MRLFPSVPAALCALACCMAACTPEARSVRVDIHADAQGQCRVGERALPCTQAGAAARTAHPDASIHAVLLIDAQASPEVKTALVGSLQQAGITHIQFGLIADDGSQKGKLVF